ncbi:MAG: FAD-binding oxidoreductase [Succinivibrio sp.]
MADFVSELKQAVKGQVIEGGEIPQKLLTDFVGTLKGRADAYLKAAGRDDVIAAVKLARRHKAPVVVRSGGTNLVGATVPDGGLVLDVSGMNRVLSFDEPTMSVTVEPGITLKDLIAYVESRGYMYPPDPAEKLGTIGGNVAMNSGGMRAVKYGVTRDYVLSLDLVRPDGEVVTLGRKVRKNATGLNLKECVIGSEGSLGVIVSVTLKLVPLPEYSLSAILAYRSLADGIRSVNAILGAHLDPTAIEFQEKKVIAYGEKFLGKEFPVPSAVAYLIVTFDGTRESVRERLAKCGEVVRKNGAFEVVPLDDPKLAADVWEIRGALARAVKASGPWEPVDTVVPLDQIAPFVASVNRISDEEGVRIVAFGHAGDGNVHLCVLKDQIPDADWPSRLDRVLRRVYDSAYEKGGMLSGEHGIGKAKRRYFLEHADKEERELMLKVKAAFDPDNLFNPHDGYAL